jgi:hypothetical protein
MSNDRTAFIETYHPQLPLWQLQGIKANDPRIINGLKFNFLKLQMQGCKVLARALSMNTCITSLEFACCKTIGNAGAAIVFPAMTQLTALTNLDLWGIGLGSTGAFHLCDTLVHLSALTDLNLFDNELTADDGARICAAVAAAGMTRLEKIYHHSFFRSQHEVVSCKTWKQLNLPQPPHEFVTIADWTGLAQFLMSSDKAAFVDKYHPSLPLELLRNIETNESTLTKLRISTLYPAEAGCRLLARVLPLTT